MCGSASRTLGVICLWGLALRLAQPFILIMLAVNVASIVLIAAIHILYVNVRLLRASCTRRCGGGWRSSRWPPRILCRPLRPRFVVDAAREVRFTQNEARDV
jgi:hypothetical protein